MLNEVSLELLIADTTLNLTVPIDQLLNIRHISIKIQARPCGIIIIFYS
jgi:hypothetical protein